MVSRTCLDSAPIAGGQNQFSVANLSPNLSPAKQIQPSRAGPNCAGLRRNKSKFTSNLQLIIRSTEVRILPGPWKCLQSGAPCMRHFARRAQVRRALQPPAASSAASSPRDRPADRSRGLPTAAGGSRCPLPRTPPDTRLNPRSPHSRGTVSAWRHSSLSPANPPNQPRLVRRPASSAFRSPRRIAARRGLGSVGAKETPARPPSGQRGRRPRPSSRG